MLVKIEKQERNETAVDDEGIAVAFRVRTLAVECVHKRVKHDNCKLNLFLFSFIFFFIKNRIDFKVILLDL